MMIFACLVVVSLMMCNDFSRQGRLVAWRGRGLRGSVSEVWTAGHGGVKGRGRGRANLSLWALCVLLICVLCEKKNVFEIRWGVFSLTELTDLTEHFAHSFELIREWPLPKNRVSRPVGVTSHITPLPAGEGLGEGPPPHGLETVRKWGLLHLWVLWEKKYPSWKIKLHTRLPQCSFSHRKTQKNRIHRVSQRH